MPAGTADRTTSALVVDRTSARTGSSPSASARDEREPDEAGRAGDEDQVDAGARGLRTMLVATRDMAPGSTSRFVYVALASGQAQRRARIQVRNSSASGENHDPLEVEVDVAQVAEGARQHAARPHVAVGADVGGEEPGVAHRHRVLVAVEEARDAVVVLDPQCPHHAGHRAARLLLVLEHGGGGGREVAAARRDAHPDRLELDALLGGLGDVGVGTERRETPGDVREVVLVLLRHDGVAPDGEVGELERRAGRPSSSATGPTSRARRGSRRGVRARGGRTTG